MPPRGDPFKRTSKVLKPLKEKLEPEEYKELKREIHNIILDQSRVPPVGDCRLCLNNITD